MPAVLAPHFGCGLDHNFNGGKDRLYASFNRTTTEKVGFGAPEVYPGFTAMSPNPPRR